MAKKKSDESVSSGSKKPTIDEFQWEEMREVIGEAIECQTPIRMKFATKLENPTWDGIPEVQGNVLFMNVAGSIRRVPMDRLISVETI